MNILYRIPYDIKEGQIGSFSVKFLVGAKNEELLIVTDTETIKDNYIRFRRSVSPNIWIYLDASLRPERVMTFLNLAEKPICNGILCGCASIDELFIDNKSFCAQCFINI